MPFGQTILKLNLPDYNRWLRLGAFFVILYALCVGISCKCVPAWWCTSWKKANRHCSFIIFMHGIFVWKIFIFGSLGHSNTQTNTERDMHSNKSQIFYAPFDCLCMFCAHAQFPFAFFVAFNKHISIRIQFATHFNETKRINNNIGLGFYFDFK